MSHVSNAIKVIPESSEPKVVAKGVMAWFGDNQVLKGIDMEIPQNEITAIIGPSGCGKSTFIRCINRMHELVDIARFEGELLLDGKNIYDTDVDPILLRRRVGMVFQKPNPFPKTIFENIAYGLKINGMRKRGKITEIVEKSLKQATI